jgi:mannose-6-phosphate isomerase-like protein (cupin superfamily)
MTRDELNMNLRDTVAVLKPDLAVETVVVSPDLYEELDARFNRFAGHVLIASYDFEADWGVWERHPAGDELVILLSGAARMALRHAAGEEFVELSVPGSFIVVPRNTWHTAYVTVKTRMLFVTPGEGTENRADI